MSIIVPMEMPESCDCCYFCNIGECDIGAEFVQHLSRPTGCPLIEVPEPQKANTKLLEESGFEL